MDSTIVCDSEVCTMADIKAGDIFLHDGYEMLKRMCECVEKITQVFRASCINGLVHVD